MVAVGTKTDDSAKSVATANSAKPVITISAIRLYEDYKANEVAADEKYKGKILQVTGVVGNIGKDIVGIMYISLKTNDLIGSVQCMFAGEHKERISQISKGTKVTIKGKCSGLMMNVILRKCSFGD